MNRLKYKNIKKFIFGAGLISLVLLLAVQVNKKDSATVFVESLNTAQKEKMIKPFDHESKENWHFLPSVLWPRQGVELRDLTAAQRNLLFELLQENLSQVGYNKVLKIIDLENVLIEIKSNVYMRDPENYNVNFYGDPGKDDVWAWTFEGHHISLNFTNVRGKVSMAPRFYGASPAIIPSGSRKGERTLAMEEDLGLQLIQEMTAAQKEIAIIQHEVFADIVTSNKPKVDPLEPAGIQLKALSKPLQKTLLLLIDTYLSNMPEDQAAKRMKQLKKEELEGIYFAWAGAMELTKGHYYRVQGKTFLIEFDNVQNDANHIHTVWRDFDGDFGRDLIKEHYHTSH